MINIASILGLLSKLKTKHILIILIIGLTIALGYQMDRSSKFKELSEQRGVNFEQLRDFSDAKIASITLENARDIEEFINSRDEMKDLYEKRLAEGKLKTKQLESIIYQKNVHINKIETNHDVTTIVRYIKDNTPTEVKWKDSVECFVIKGKIVFTGDSLYNSITERSHINKLLLTGYKQRPQKNWWTRNFGRWESVASVTSECGDTETIRIFKKKK